MIKLLLGILAGVFVTLAFGAFLLVYDAEAETDTELRPLLGVVKP